MTCQRNCIYGSRAFIEWRLTIVNANIYFHKWCTKRYIKIQIEALFIAMFSIAIYLLIKSAWWKYSIISWKYYNQINMDNQKTLAISYLYIIYVCMIVCNYVLRIKEAWKTLILNQYYTCKQRKYVVAFFLISFCLFPYTALRIMERNIKSLNHITSRWIQFIYFCRHWIIMEVLLGIF